MPDLLNPDRPGDVTALGFTSKNPPSEDIPVQEEAAQATAAEEEVPEEEPKEEVQAQEAEPAEDESKSILSQLAEQEPVVPVVPEVTRLQQENLRLEAALRERRQVAEDQIRAAAAAPAQVEEPESYLKSPYVQQTLRHIREEQPEQYEQTLIEIAKAEFAKEVEAREKAHIERMDKSDQQGQEATQRAAVKQGISTALNEIRAEGGLHAELVEEFELRGMDSHIGRKMQEVPQMFYSQQGTEDAVRSLESKLRSQIARAKHPEQAQAVQGTVTSAGTGVASTRGVNLNEKPVKKSPEDEYLDSFTGASRGGASLEFL